MGIGSWDRQVGQAVGTERTGRQLGSTGSQAGRVDRQAGSWDRQAVRQAGEHRED